MRQRSLQLAIAVGLGLGQVAQAQFEQYIAPGSLAEIPAERKTALAQAVKDARWRLGPLRVEPWLALRELGYVKNAALAGVSAEGDYTATVGGGLRGYLPVGGHTTIALSALPEYVWWRHESAQRRLDGRYGAGVFTDFNRFRLELTGTTFRELGIVTPEVEQQINSRSDQGALDLEVPLAGRLALFAHGEFDRIRSDPKTAGTLEELFTPIDRDEHWGTAGFRFHLTRELTIGAGGGASSVDFARDARDRSNRGRSATLELRLDRPKFGVAIQATQTRLTGEPGSEIGRATVTSGTGQIRWAPRDRFALSLYGDRQVVYSVFAASPYFLDAREGVAVSTKIGWRTSLELFGEVGGQSYRNADGASIGRTDDVRSAGARIDMTLRRSVTLTASLRRTSITGGAGAPDRRYDEVRFGLVLGGAAGLWY